MMTSSALHWLPSLMPSLGAKDDTPPSVQMLRVTLVSLLVGVPVFGPLDMPQLHDPSWLWMSVVGGAALLLIAPDWSSALEVENAPGLASTCTVPAAAETRHQIEAAVVVRA